MAGKIARVHPSIVAGYDQMAARLADQLASHSEAAEECMRIVDACMHGRHAICGLSDSDIFALAEYAVAGAIRAYIDAGNGGGE